MDPQGPSQPNLDTAYEQPSNPAQSTSENAASKSTSASLQRSGPTAERRGQSDVSSGGGNQDDQSNAMPSALGYGARDASGDAGDSMGGAVNNQEGEQMRAAGEGDIASAQDKKHGFGEQGDLASGLDRKKDEQGKVKEARGSVPAGGGVDVGAAIGGRDKGFVGANNEDTNSAGLGTGMQSSHADV